MKSYEPFGLTVYFAIRTKRGFVRREAWDVTYARNLKQRRNRGFDVAGFFGAIPNLMVTDLVNEHHFNKGELV